MNFSMHLAYPNEQNARECPAELLAGVHSGRYPVVGTGARGNPIIDFGRPIGVDGRTGQTVTRGQIHYGKNGAHIVPDGRN